MGPGTARRTARNAAVSAAANVLGKVATLVWTAVAARVLGSGDFGAFFYAFSFAMLLSSAVEWGFDALMAERASRDAGLVGALFTRAVVWEVLVGVPLFTLGWLLAAPFRPTGTASLVLAIVLLAVLFEVLGGSVRAAAAAAQDQRGASYALLVQRAVTLVAIPAALAAGTGVVGLSVSFLAASVIGLVSGLVAVRPLGVRLSRAALGRAPMAEFVRGTWVLGLNTLVLMSLFRVDNVLLGALTDDREVGRYAAAYRLLETVLFVVFALRSAIFPVITADGTREVVKKGIETTIAAMSVVYLPFGVFCLLEARAVLALIYGDDYADASTTTLRWLALAPMAYGVAFLANAALHSASRHRAMLLGGVVGTVLNVALNLLLIPRYGGAAAAFATTASYAVVAVVVLLALRARGTSISLLRPVREPLVASAVLALALWASPLPLLVELAAGAALYLALWAALVRTCRPDLVDGLRAVLPSGRRR